MKGKVGDARAYDHETMELFKRSIIRESRGGHFCGHARTSVAPLISDFNPFLLFQSVTVWLGGLFIPEAYITATRQFVAQANHWSLEELKLEVI